eukprot:6517591-Ditylum_brightwellii.AAC.2
MAALIINILQSLLWLLVDAKCEYFVHPGHLHVKEWESLLSDQFDFLYPSLEQTCVVALLLCNVGWYWLVWQVPKFSCDHEEGSIDQFIDCELETSQPSGYHLLA